MLAKVYAPILLIPLRSSPWHVTPGGHAGVSLIWGDIPLQHNGAQQMLGEGKHFITLLHLEL